MIREFEEFDKWWFASYHETTIMNAKNLDWQWKKVVNQYIKSFIRENFIPRSEVEGLLSKKSNGEIDQNEWIPPKYIQDLLIKPEEK